MDGKTGVEMMSETYPTIDEETHRQHTMKNRYTPKASNIQIVENRYKKIKNKKQ